MTPPALVDITGDGVCDIVFSSFNSTVLALDGDTYNTLWSFSYPSSETYAYVTIGLKLNQNLRSCLEYVNAVGAKFHIDMEINEVALNFIGKLCIICEYLARIILSSKQYQLFGAH